MIRSTNELEVSLKNGVRTIRFNRPQKKNAICYEMYRDIAEILNTDANDDSVKICVLTGTGEYYSSGNDIASNMKVVSESREAGEEILTNNVDRFIKAFINYPKFLVAVVNGPAIGVAVTTLGLCDAVFASDSATFQTPFSKLALCPEGCSSYLFPKIMGKSKASEMLFFSHKMTAEEALRVGFVSEIIPRAKLGEIFERINETYSQTSLNSIRMTKNLLRKDTVAVLHEVNKREMKQLSECFKTEDFMDAVMNFMSRPKKSKM